MRSMNFSGEYSLQEVLMPKHSFGHRNGGSSGSNKTEAQEIQATSAEENAKTQNNSQENSGNNEASCQNENAASTGQIDGAPGVQSENTPVPETEPAGPASKIADLEAKLAELNDQYLRKTADFENFRKRMNREKQELVDFANQNLLMDLLPVIDDFERAIKSAETCSSLKSSKEFSGFFEGIVMIEKSLSTKLENKWGLKRFDSEGELFDPNRHEAIQMEKSPDISEAVVKDDYLKGYLLKDRVIRFAKVKVLMPADSPTVQNTGEGEKNGAQ